MKILLFLAIIVFLHPVYAWNYDTHQNLAQNTAANLNVSLDLNSLKEGAIAPDKDFKDFRNHHYPNSYEKASSWLEIANSEYLLGNINNASYAFGVASHYITDSFSDPHYISGESSYSHSKYEDRSYYKIKTPCAKYALDLNNSLYLASQENNWDSWLSSNDNSIPESKLEESSKVLYASALKTFRASCLETKKNYIPEIIAASIALVLISFIITRAFGE